MSASGMNSQLGFAAEGTYGTYTAPNRFSEFTSESLSLEIERMVSAGLRANRRVPLSSQWTAGRRNVSGSLEMELLTHGQGLLWAHAFGSTATTGTGPFTHTYSPGDMQTQSLTIQIGRPAVISAVVHPFSYTGCKINSWEISASAGEIATVTFDILGRDETTAQTLAAATYPAAAVPMTFVHGALTIGGTAVAVNSITVSGNNNLRDDRYFINGSALRSLPIEGGKREYTFDAEAEFLDLTLYNRYVNGTEAALVLTFTNGANIFRVTGNVRHDGGTPTVGGPDILMQPLSGMFLASGATDDTAIKIERVTTEATATA